MDNFPLKIGFWCSDKKWNELGHNLRKEIKRLSRETISLEHISLATPISKISSSFCCILQKNPNGFHADASQLPGLISSSEIHKLVSSRACFFTSLTKVPGSVPYFPNFIGNFQIHLHTSIEEIKRTIVERLTFPIIIKNDMAYGNRISHNMCIVANAEDLTFKLFSSLIGVCQSEEEHKKGLIGFGLNFIICKVVLFHSRIHSPL